MNVKSILVASIPVLLALAGYIRYDLQKAKERNTVNRVIISEISRLLALLNQHLKWWFGLVRNNNTDFPLIPFTTDVYDNFLKNIGDLDKMYAGDAVRFYGYVKFMNAIQKSRAKHKAEQQQAFVVTYTRSLYNALTIYGHLFPTAFRKFDARMPEMDKELLKEVKAWLDGQAE